MSNEEHKAQIPLKSREHQLTTILRSVNEMRVNLSWRRKRVFEKKRASVHGIKAGTLTTCFHVLSISPDNFGILSFDFLSLPSSGFQKKLVISRVCLKCDIVELAKLKTITLF